MTVQEAMQHHYELCERIKRLADYEQAINNVYAVCGTKDIVNDGINNTILNGQFSPFDVVAHISSVASAFLTSDMPVTPEMLHAGIDYAVEKLKHTNGGVIAPLKINPDDLPPNERHN